MSKLFTKHWVQDFLVIAGLLASILALILFPQQSIEAAKEGLGLCYNVIIPSLFPFFVLSSLVVELGLAHYLGRALHPIMWPLFRVNGRCASALALGFVGGYPVGAKTAIALYEKGACTKTEAERLLAFCNNSGPAFILGVVGAGIFADGRVGFLLYLAHALASLSIGLLFRFYKATDGRGHSQTTILTTVNTTHFPTAFTQSVTGACTSTLNICAFVIFFTVFIRMLSLSGLLPVIASGLATLFHPLGLTYPWAQRLLTGVIELSSGVWSLTGEGGLMGKISMAAFMLGWAGVSIHCQVLCFLSNSGLSARVYFLGKLLHGVLSALFVSLLVHFFPLESTVSSYLVGQVEEIATLEFQQVLTISTVTAWIMWLAFFIIALWAIGKNSGKGRKHMI